VATFVGRATGASEGNAYTFLEKRAFWRKKIEQFAWLVCLREGIPTMTF
jgi:hypothetical protein